MKVKRKTFKCCATGCVTLALVLFCTGSLHAAQVNAQLDRDRIVQGETVTLVVQTDDPQQSLEGNFGVLEKDFQLLDQRSETQMSIVNGRQSAVVRLMLTLEPRSVGVITVPPLRFGSQTTSPLQLTVEAAPEPKPGEAPTVFIEVEVEPRDGPYYVHAQMQLTVRVFYQQSLTEAAISQPEPSPASVRLLDEVPFQADRGGERYRVLERHYAVFPERSGPLEIPPMKLSGRVVERRSDKLWQPTVRGRRIEVSSDAIELTIQPKPASYQGTDWIPARSLELSQTISAGDSLTVGEPVTRTIIVDVVGLEENMITPPVWPEIADARIYPDQPQGISRNDGKWVLGHKEFRYAVVPEKEGELVLPELRLHWWDTRNNREQTAVLPEKRLRVQPSSVVPATPPPITESMPSSASPAPMNTSADGKPADRLWAVLTFVFAGLWLITTVLLIKRPRASSVSKVTPEEIPATEAGLLADIRKACERGDAGAVRRRMARWLQEFGPSGAGESLLTFSALAADPALQQAMREMDASGFRMGSDSSWKGDALWKAFNAWLTRWRSEKKENKPAVTDLYAQAR